MTYRYLCYSWSTDDKLGATAIESRIEVTGENPEQNKWLFRECARDVDFIIDGILIIPVANIKRSNKQ